MGRDQENKEERNSLEFQEERIAAAKDNRRKKKQVIGQKGIQNASNSERGARASPRENRRSNETSTASS